LEHIHINLLSCHSKVLDQIILHDKSYGDAWNWPARWQEIQQLLFFLKPFAESTTFMSAQKYATISGVVVHFNVILDHLEDYLEQGPEESEAPDYILRAAKAAYKKILEYYRKTNDIHCIVTLLDPRCNIDYFWQNHFTEELIDPFRDR